MRFTYRPEGGEPREWLFNPAKMPNVEAEAIEDLTGWTWQEFGERFNRGSSKAYHALLYVLLHRTTPGLKYDQVQFSMHEIELDYDDQELQALHDAMVDHLDDLDAADMAMLDGLKEELEKRGLAGEPAPKVSEENGVGDTSGTSPISSTSPQLTSTS